MALDQRVAVGGRKSAVSRQAGWPGTGWGGPRGTHNDPALIKAGRL